MVFLTICPYLRQVIPIYKANVLFVLICIFKIRTQFVNTSGKPKPMADLWLHECPSRTSDLCRTALETLRRRCEFSSIFVAIVQIPAPPAGSGAVQTSTQCLWWDTRFLDFTLFDFRVEARCAKCVSSFGPCRKNSPLTAVMLAFSLNVWVYSDRDAKSFVSDLIMHAYWLKWHLFSFFWNVWTSWLYVYVIIAPFHFLLFTLLASIVHVITAIIISPHPLAKGTPRSRIPASPLPLLLSRHLSPSPLSLHSRRTPPPRLVPTPLPCLLWHFLSFSLYLSNLLLLPHVPVTSPEAVLSALCQS